VTSHIADFLLFVFYVVMLDESIWEIGIELTIHRLGFDLQQNCCW